MNNKTATECRNILRGELDSAIDSYVPMKKQGNGLKRNIYQKRRSERLDINKICGGFINYFVHTHRNSYCLILYFVLICAQNFA